jgi:GLPGLI family protein
MRGLGLLVLCWLVSGKLVLAQKGSRFIGIYEGYDAFTANHQKKSVDTRYKLLIENHASYCEAVAMQGFGQGNDNVEVLMLPRDSILGFTFKDRRTNRVTFNPYMITEKRKVLVEDSLHDFSWVITTISKKIDTLECFKAMCIWRGRAYTAWFAPSLPFDNGPQKFGGLPGLIVELYSDNHEVYRKLVTFAPFEGAIPVRPIPTMSYQQFIARYKKNWARVIEQLTANDNVQSDCKTCGEKVTFDVVSLEYFLQVN